MKARSRKFLRHLRTLASLFVEFDFSLVWENFLMQLQPFSPSEQLQIFRILQFQIYRLVPIRRCSLETATPIEPAQLESFRRISEKSRKISLRIEPSLIAGVRFTLDDRRWEHSFHQMLCYFEERMAKKSSMEGDVAAK